MSEDALINVLQSDNLLLDEGDILDKVTEWSTVNSVSSLQQRESEEGKQTEGERTEGERRKGGFKSSNYREHAYLRGSVGKCVTYL